jgi:hypothetical protein
MTTDNPETHAPASPAAPAVAAATPAVRDPFDPLGWEVPVICKDCEKPFKVPYRHFHAGVVFHCPHCHGSFVPTLTMYRRVHSTFEMFYGRMKLERDAAGRTGGDEATFKRKFEAELTRFNQQLEQLAYQMHPAGKLVRRRGLAAMFT